MTTRVRAEWRSKRDERAGTPGMVWAITIDDRAPMYLVSLRMSSTDAEIRAGVAAFLGVAEGEIDLERVQR